MAAKRRLFTKMKLPIIFPDSLSADSVAINNDRILAANGFRCIIYNVSSKCCITTARPYFFISSCFCNGGLLALSERCGNRIYVLNCELEETAAITPNVFAGPLLSAFLYPDRTGILLTYRNTAVKIGTDGRVLEVVGTANNEGTDFLSSFPLCNGYLLAYTENDQTIIKLLSCNESSFILPHCVRFKGFTSDCNGTVYALIGKGYPYTYLTPIYENCELIPFSENNEVFCQGF